MLQTTRALIPMSVVLLLAGCGGGASDVETTVQTYTVRGRVLTMPGDAGGEIQLEHEAIDDFVDFRGDVVGMDAMTMSFPLAEGVGEGISEGDIVEFDLRVDWEAEPLSLVTRMEKLPAETELVFGRAEPGA